MEDKKGNTIRCPREDCRSTHVVNHGYNVTVKRGRLHRLKCQSCGHTFYDETNSEEE